MTINDTDTDKELKFLRERMRHSAAHIMADAVLKLFPNAKLAIGHPLKTVSIMISNWKNHSHQMIWTIYVNT